jgi:hypothetical protein
MLWEQEHPELRAKELASDLLTLKIETVYSERITGGAMSDPRIGLCQIAARYATALSARRQEKLCAALLPAITAAAAEVGLQKARSDGEITGGRDAFYGIALLADAELLDLAAEGGMTEDAGRRRQHHRLERVRANAREIYNILCTCDDEILRSIDDAFVVQRADGGAESGIVWPFELNPRFCNDGMTRELVEFGYVRKKLPPLELTRRQVTLIRKVWELGLETVVMQTVIQIDGDVVTRVDPDHAASAHAQLHQIHQSAIGVSVGFWRELVTLAATLVQSLWSTVFGRLRRASGAAPVSPS